MNKVEQEKGKQSGESGNLFQTFLEFSRLEKCRRCQAYFAHGERRVSRCVYHPGAYNSVKGAGGSLVPQSVFSKWSCCYDFDQMAVGCQVGRHLPDRAHRESVAEFSSSMAPSEMVQMSAAEQRVLLSHFEDFCKKRMLRRRDDSRVEEFREGGEGEGEGAGEGAGDGRELFEFNAKGELRHQVRPGDTFMGLALLYGSSAGEIKRANGIHSTMAVSCTEHFVLWIPRPTKYPREIFSDEAAFASGRREILLMRFVSQTGCCKEEAIFYLEDLDWDFQEALDQYRDDMQWESAYKLKQKE